MSVKPWVKTSMAPGSKVVQRYRGRRTVAYSKLCVSTSSASVAQPVSATPARCRTPSAMLSKKATRRQPPFSYGNRNSQGRVSPDCRANYLASPPLVVAYALAGTMDIDFATEPVGHDPNGAPIS